jgi:hypothetical protein
MKDRELYLMRASEARAEADAALLDNVRERCLRSEAAWHEMAARVERTEQLRTAAEADKGSARPLAPATPTSFGLERSPQPRKNQ